jgi:GNAT superfamily N-acetyltransferase
MEPIISDVRDELLEKLLTEKIRDYNNIHSTRHREIRDPAAILPFYACFEYPAGELVAGIFAESYWGWMDIEKLWVSEDHRGKGLGSRLMDEAENAAAARGCRKLFLTTFGFQAPGFYLKRGFSILGIREDYPPGGRYYWLEKTLPG